MTRAPLTIPPEVRSRLRRLALRTRRDRGDAGFGMHASRNKGSGIEFSQYRSYEPGDEPRRIDWKLFARSDRFFVREAEQESPVSVWVLIDASASMAQADRARPGWSRLDAAKLIALCIAELATMQGDRFGWITPKQGALGLADPRRGRAQMARMQVDFARLGASGTFADSATLAPLWNRIAARDLVIFLSDCFDEGGIAMIERLARAGREVLSVQMLTAEERDFPFHGGFRFRDPETGEELVTDGAMLRETFLERFAAAREALAARLDAAGIRHAAYVLDQPVDAPLQSFFAAKGRAA
ncbi:DUF58 domain-containing protein [Erythrobacter neustonensis]|uniref:DUF58 domain-containing protein n=1 Tax=Erythrobacter neustonensis TaxID=1112 RepID=A0A192D5P5_9SPHN|nr:DUF58 domain-containing protein [Erythrobacter neustonensis]ANK13410.1 hypothetical protein A9D12_11190 [Erythrobacter neustonensis]